ncbi:hypothetical protein [Hyalangium versicolor]|uniref:hypothetical protein n=1 Tax=Hyalangium versicolor TaxID=2861190 RepID=UPI001CC925DA|nr:hypothetical protein [Hyalangium versicolor]
MARTVLLGESGASAPAPQRQTRSQRVARPLVTVPIRLASPLAVLAHAKRSQLRALEAVGVTASVRVVVEGRTLLASLLPTRESTPEAVARRQVRRVFTLHRHRGALAVLVERR